MWARCPATSGHPLSHTRATGLSPGGMRSLPVPPRPVGQEHGSPASALGLGWGLFTSAHLEALLALGPRRPEWSACGEVTAHFWPPPQCLGRGQPRHLLPGAGPQHQEGCLGSIEKRGRAPRPPNPHPKGSMPLGKQVRRAGDSVLVPSPGVGCPTWARLCLGLVGGGPGREWGTLQRSPGPALWTGWGHMMWRASPALSPA